MLNLVQHLAEITPNEPGQVMLPREYSKFLLCFDCVKPLDVSLQRFV